MIPTSWLSTRADRYLCVCGACDLGPNVTDAENLGAPLCQASGRELAQAIGR